MAFENIKFRQCSYNYNNPSDNADDSTFVVQESKDIGNTGGAEDCIRLDLSKLSTKFNEDVSITQQIEIFFQPEFMLDGTEILATFPVDQRQGLFRLPQKKTDGSIIYIGERSPNNATQYAYISIAKVTGLIKTTKPDGSPLFGYSSTDGSTQETILTFPAPTTTSEYTIKRLTHSFSDFVVYQPGAQLTSNVLNFQKEQEMFLIQELLWTIEMDMVTFSDLSGKGQIVTTGADGFIDVNLINMSIFDLNDVYTPDQSESVLYCQTANAKRFIFQSVGDLLNLKQIKDVNYSGTPTTNHVLTWTGSVWEPASVDAASETCQQKLVASMKFCQSTTNSDVVITDIFTVSDSFDPIATKLMTPSGILSVPLGKLKDVDETDISNGDLLQYDDSGSSPVYKPVDPTTLGVPGAPGGSAFKFTFNSTDPLNSPSSGELGFQGSSFAAITRIDFDQLDADGVDVHPWANSFNPLNTDDVATNDLIKVYKSGSPENFVLAKITSTAQSGDNNRLFVTVISSSGAFFSNSDTVYLSHIPSGLVGLDGDDGLPGTEGSKGDPGQPGAAFTSVDVEFANANQDLKFTFTYPAGSVGPDGDLDEEVIATLEDWAGTATHVWYYVDSADVDVTAYGKYTYTLSTDGSGTGAISAINNMELANEGTTEGANRTFQGITYSSPISFSGMSNERVYGVGTKDNDLYKLLPIAVGTKVLVTNSEFSIQNVIELIECAS